MSEGIIDLRSKNTVVVEYWKAEYKKVRYEQKILVPASVWEELQGEEIIETLRLDANSREDTIADLEEKISSFSQRSFITSVILSKFSFANFVQSEETYELPFRKYFMLRLVGIANNLKSIQSGRNVISPNQQINIEEKIKKEVTRILQSDPDMDKNDIIFNIASLFSSSTKERVLFGIWYAAQWTAHRESKLSQLSEKFSYGDECSESNPQAETYIQLTDFIQEKLLHYALFDKKLLKKGLEYFKEPIPAKRIRKPKKKVPWVDVASQYSDSDDSKEEKRGRRSRSNSRARARSQDRSDPRSRDISRPVSRARSQTRSISRSRDTSRSASPSIRTRPTIDLIDEDMSDSVPLRHEMSDYPIEDLSRVAIIESTENRGRDFASQKEKRRNRSKSLASEEEDKDINSEDDALQIPLVTETIPPLRALEIRRERIPRKSKPKKLILAHRNPNSNDPSLTDTNSNGPSFEMKGLFKECVNPLNFVVTFTGKVKAKCIINEGPPRTKEYLVRWFPEGIIADQWFNSKPSRNVKIEVPLSEIHPGLISSLLIN